MDLTTILLGLAVLNGLIILHELGHFLVARRAGMVTPEFAVGFGPRLLGFTRGETTYSLRLFPLGGYVHLPDLAPEPDEEPVAASRRFWTILAGPLANLALVVLVMGPAEAWASIVLWFQLMGELLVQLVTGNANQGDVGLVGPIGISSAVGQAASMGLGSLLRLTAFLSLNLGLFNLLPFPGLDGGRLLGLLIEKLNGGRRASWEPVVQGLGLLLFLGLGLWVTGKELLSVIGWL